MPRNASWGIELSVLKAKQQADNDRMNDAADKIDLYTDDANDIIEAQLKAEFVKQNYDRLKLNINKSQNILKRVINEISTIYKAEAHRTTGDKPNDRYQEILKESYLDVKLKKVNRYTNLLNECLLKPTIRKGRFCFDIITPNIAFVFQDEDDPTLAKGICYQISYVNTRGRSDVDWHFWSVDEGAGEYVLFDNNFRPKKTVYGEDGEKGPYPYLTKEKEAVLPFVTFHRDSPDYTFWDQDTGGDLYNAGVRAHVKMTMMDYFFKTCSFKQIYIIGDTSKMPQDQIMDTASPLSCPAGEGAEIGVLDIQNNMKQLQDALAYNINAVVNNYGISADQFTLVGGEMSGRALKIRNRALMEIREEQIPLYRQYEWELFSVIRIVNNAWAGGGGLKKKLIPWELEFAVDFAEIEFPEDPIEEIEIQSKYLNSGIISLGGFYQHFNTDVTDEAEAEKTITANLKKLKELKAEYPALDESLAAILGMGMSGGGGDDEGAGDGGGGDKGDVKNKDDKEGKEE